MLKSKYKFYHQLDYMDCGPTCLRMVAGFYGKDYSLDYLREKTFVGRNGVSIKGLCQAAEDIGLKTFPAKLDYEQIKDEVPLPCILHWNQEHFVVLYDVKKKSLFHKDDILIIADPGHGVIKVDKSTFVKSWICDSSDSGIALLLEPMPDFFNKSEVNNTQPAGFRFLFQYLQPYKRYMFQVFLGMILTSFISMLFPFLTQSLVDYGIQLNNQNFIHLVLFSQLLLFLGSIAVDMIRNWVLLHVNSRLSISIISNFLAKLMRLPISFFEAKNIGDISQRINDHHRIEGFLTGSTLSSLFSFINLIIFSFVLASYNFTLLLVFLIGSIISVAWVFLFLRKRKNIDYNRFQQLRENQNSIFELITGMQEIKLNNCEQRRRWEWERIQAKLFKVNIQSLTLEQYQEVGSSFFSQVKNILLSYIAAMLVIEQQITLGAMLSISYIIGQMNGPLNQLMDFVKKIQDAKISLDRLGEIHNKKDEEIGEKFTGDLLQMKELLSFSDKLNIRGIVLEKVCFQYGGPHTKPTIDNLSLSIPEGKVTAIVGASGSGKTTLLKLLLQFYHIQSGSIHLNGQLLENVSPKQWREKCGTVMQDGFIFSDTIARNIAVDGQKIDFGKLKRAIQIANLEEFISGLPLQLETKIGNTGSGLSGGQKQRIFIARAVYKNPEYIFFDEATSALDSNNEKIIMSNLDKFFKGKTVLVIAHRLSTVRNADQIVVLNNGKLTEIGNHSELTAHRGFYYELIKNQLELAA